jgi:hypothetical protein
VILEPQPSHTTFMYMQSSSSCVPKINSSYVNWYWHIWLLHLNLTWFKYSSFNLFKNLSPFVASSPSHLHGVLKNFAEVLYFHSLMHGSQKLTSHWGHSFPCTMTLEQYEQFKLYNKETLLTVHLPLRSLFGLIPW